MAVDSFDATDGHPIFLDGSAPDGAVNPTKVGEYAADVGNRIVRPNLAGLNAYAFKRAGLEGHALDTGVTYIHNGSGWVGAAALATAPGSVVPTALSGFTLSSNNLYTRNGFLLGSIEWAKTSGALVHGDSILTLPVGARPVTDSAVDAVMSPSPAQFQQLAVTTVGVVSALAPVSARTGGSIRFAMAIPL